MQYWLIGYGSTCPTSSPSGVSNWHNDTVDGQYDCWASSGPYTAATELPSNLGNVLLEGITGQSGNDVAKMCDYSTDQCTALSATDFMNLGSSNWTYSEFNVFGYGGSPVGPSQANFNSGTPIGVEVHLWDTSGNSDPATCNGGGYTAETNDLTLVSGSCSAGTGYMDFSESN
jgi:hypothetical protein